MMMIKEKGKEKTKRKKTAHPKRESAPTSSHQKRAPQKKEFSKSEKSQTADKTCAEKETCKRRGEGNFKKIVGPYRAPPPSKTMIMAMIETGPAYAECYFMNEYKNDEESHNYVEIQIFEIHCSATRAKEP